MADEPDFLTRISPTVPANLTQIGYTTPYSFDLSETGRGNSFTVIGRDVSVNWEAVGMGSGIRPDITNAVKINLTREDPKTSEKINICNISISATGLYEIYKNNFLSPQAPATKPGTFPTKAIGKKNVPSLQMELKEVSVCEEEEVLVNGIKTKTGNVIEKRMVILASQTYLPNTVP